MKTILVFKTSVQNKEDLIRLQPILDKALRQNEKLNFDLEDCDNILRVEAFLSNAEDFIHILNEAGYFCQELEN